MKTFMISVICPEGPQVGAVLVQAEGEIDVAVMEVGNGEEDGGEDVKLMGLNQWHDVESMIKLGY